jgi:serine/threonine-protein kinase
MAPEQARGRPDEVEPRTDVYGLGAILYEILTGRPPFTGDSALDILHKVCAEQPARPREILADVPPALEAICLKALAKDPEGRYPLAGSLAADVLNWLAGEPVSAWPEPWSVRARRWVGRHRTLVTSAAAAAGVALASLALSTALLLAANERERQAKGHAERNEQEARRQEGRASRNFGLAKQAVDQFCTKVSADKRLLRHDLEGLRKELLQEGVTFYSQLAEVQAGDPDRHAGLQADRAKTYDRLARLTAEVAPAREAIAHYQAALAIYGQLNRDFPDVAEHRTGLAGVYNGLGNTYQVSARHEAALECYGEAVALWRRLALDHPEVAAYRSEWAKTTANLGLLYDTRADRAKAEAAYDEALAVQSRLAAEHPRVADYQTTLAGVHVNRGRLFVARLQPVRAAESYGEAVGILKKLVLEHPRSRTTRRAWPWRWTTSGSPITTSASATRLSGATPTPGTSGWACARHTPTSPSTPTGSPSAVITWAGCTGWASGPARPRRPTGRPSRGVTSWRGATPTCPATRTCWRRPTTTSASCTAQPTPRGPRRTIRRP